MVDHLRWLRGSHEDCSYLTTLPEPLNHWLRTAAGLTVATRNIRLSNKGHPEDRASAGHYFSSAMFSDKNFDWLCFVVSVSKTADCEPSCIIIWNFYT